MIRQATIMVCCIFAALFTYSQGIQFEQQLSWTDIKKKARVENKYIFMDAYATWCGPCKAMAEEIFPQASVGEVINANFISVKVQMDHRTEDDEFVKSWYANADSIAKESNLTAYPTLLFFSSEGKLVHKSIGYKDAESLIAEAKKALKSSTQFFVLIEQFKKGGLDTAQMRSLAIQAKEMGDQETASMVAQSYIKSISRTGIYEKDHLLFIAEFLEGSGDPNFNIFLKNAKKVNKMAGDNFAENTVMKVIAKEEISPDDKLEKPDWEAIEKKVVAKYGALGEERVWGHRLVYYASMKDWVNCGKYYKKYFRRALPNKRSFININNLSWTVFLHISNPEVISTAIEAMKYEMERFNNTQPHIIDTYANLLYKAGNKEDAVKWEEKAVQLSNNEISFVETLEKMRLGKKTW